MSDRLSVFRCQRALALLWLIAAGLILLLMIAQSSAGHYGDQTSAAWGWLMPNLLPVLTLILGAVVSTAPESTLRVPRFTFHVSFAVSAFYLALVLAVLLAQPFSGLRPDEMLAAMKSSNLWLGPLQGLVGICLGVFFGHRAGNAEAAGA